MRSTRPFSLELLLALLALLVVSARGSCFAQTPEIIKQEPIPYLPPSSQASPTPSIQSMPRQATLELPRVLRGCWQGKSTSNSVEVLDPSLGRPGSYFTSSIKLCYLQREGSGQFELSSSDSSADTNDLHLLSSVDGFLLGTGLATMKREVLDDHLQIVSTDGERLFALHHHTDYTAHAALLFGLLSGSSLYVADTDMNCLIEPPEPKSVFSVDAQGNVRINSVAANRWSVHCSDDGTVDLNGRAWLRVKGLTEMTRIDE